MKIMANYKAVFAMLVFVVGVGATLAFNACEVYVDDPYYMQPPGKTYSIRMLTNKKMNEI